MKSMFSYAIAAVYISERQESQIALSTGVVIAETQEAAEAEVAQLMEVYPSGVGMQLRSVVREVSTDMLNRELRQEAPIALLRPLERLKHILDAGLKEKDQLQGAADTRRT